MTKKIIKITAVLVGAILALIVATFFSVYFWLAQGERNASYMKPYVESVLTKKLGGTPVAVKNLILGVNKESRAIAIRGEEIGIGSVSAKNLITLPQISLEVGLQDLFLGRIGLGDIAMENLAVTFTKSDGRFYILIGRKAEPGDPGIDMNNLGFGGNSGSLVASSDYYIKSMQLIDGSVYYYDLDNKLSAKAESINLQIGQGERNSLQISMNAETESGGANGKVSLIATIKKSTLAFEANISLENFRCDFMKGFSEPFAKAGGLELPLGGSIFLSGSPRQSELRELKFDLNLGEGILNIPDLFDGKAPVKSAKVSGYAKDNLKQLELNSFEVNLAKGVLAGNAAVIAKRSGHLVELKATLDGMPANYIKTYWPLTLYPNIRSWVTEHIKEGNVPKAYVNLHLDPDEHKQGTTWPKTDDVDSEVQFEGSELEYLKGFPKITGITGKATFTGDKMVITASSGSSLKGTEVNAAKVEIRNFHEQKTRMHVSVGTQTNLPDVFRFLENPIFGKVNEKMGFSPDKSGGEVKADVALDFLLSPVGAKNNPHDLNYKISGGSENAWAKGILEGFDAESSKLETTVTPEQIDISGTSTVNGVPLEIKINKPLQAKAPHNFTLSAKTMQTGTSISDLGISSLNFIKGKLDFDLLCTGLESGNQIKLSANLKDTELKHDDYGLIKPVGVPASLKMDALYNPEVKMLDISSLSLEGEAVSISGAISVNTDAGSLTSANLKSVRFGANDFSITTTKDKDGVRNMRVSGKSIDIAPFIKKQNQTYPERLRVSINTDKAFSVNETSANSFSYNGDCEGNTCHKLDMTGTNQPSNSSFNVKIATEQTVKTLQATAENAGEFLRFIDSYTTMKDGLLKASGTYNNFGNAETLEGKAVITDFRITSTPVLAKLLSIASLTGILDGLNSTGISFTRLDIPFTRSGSTINITDAKCAGASVGLTAEGRLDQQSRQMNLKGTLVPAYALNSILSNVPVIGEVLTGGKGKGIFAFNFTAAGAFENPEISVNPLSVITPGFLRDLFSSEIPPEGQQPPANNNTPQQNPVKP